MKKLKSIDRKNLPAKAPLITTIMCALCLEVWNGPEWLYGVLGAFCLFIWIAFFYALVNEEYVDLLNSKDSKKIPDCKPPKSKFQSALEEAMEKSKAKDN